MDWSGCLSRGRKRDWLLHSKRVSGEPGLDPVVHFQQRMEKHMSLSSGSSTSCGDARHDINRVVLSKQT